MSKADLHIHTTASGHAFSTVDEIVCSAKEKGLEVIALTDHYGGPGGVPGGAHPFLFQNLRIVPKVIKGVRVLRGVEANIIDYEGHIDVPKEILDELDIVIASFHPSCIEFSTRDVVTHAMCLVMENPYVTIIGHPGDARYPFDAEAVAKKAKQTRTLLEINNASLKPTTFRPGVRENLKNLLHWCEIYQVPIIVSTDAHICYEVGDIKESLALLEEVDFPRELVMNNDIEKLMRLVATKRLI
jgi:putative hydrolase